MTDADKINGGKSRKQTEKKRRDRFNSLLHELGEAIISEPVAKLDKITVLRHIVNFFRGHEGRKKTAGTMCPPCLTSGEFSMIALDCLDCFVLVLDRTGSILFASDDTLPCMGFVPAHLVGSNFFKLVHDDSKRSVYSQLLRQQQREKPTVQAWTTAHSPLNVDFACKMYTGSYKRSTDRSESVRCYGQVYGEKNSCLVVLVKLDHPEPNKTLAYSGTDQESFCTEFDLKWKYTSIDESATSVLGYLPAEMAGRSEYELVHPDDLNKLLKYHEVLLRAGRVTTCYYRLLTKAHCWIWVRTSCCVKYCQWNGKPDRVTCVTIAVGYCEVCLRYKDVLREDVEKFKRFRERTSKGKAIKPTGNEPSSSSRNTRSDGDLPVGFSSESLTFQWPSGLTSTQMLIHMNLRERYTKLSRKMQRYVHQMNALQTKMDLQEGLAKESGKQLDEKIPESKQLQQSPAELPTGDALESHLRHQPLPERVAEVVVQEKNITSRKVRACGVDSRVLKYHKTNEQGFASE